MVVVIVVVVVVVLVDVVVVVPVVVVVVLVGACTVISADDWPDMLQKAVALSTSLSSAGTLKVSDMPLELS